MAPSGSNQELSDIVMQSLHVYSIMITTITTMLWTLLFPEICYIFCWVSKIINSKGWVLLDFIEDHFLVNLTAERYWLSLKLVSETLLAFDFFIQ